MGVFLISKQRKKLILAIALIITVNVFIIALAQYASAELYKRGSSGAVVREIQTRLQAWGYYSGSIDGVYGSRTEKAVKYFQQKNGLTADGQAGSATLAALGINTGGGASSGGNGNGGGGGSGNGDVDLLARLISAEARGESYTGQVAVGAVVLNRVRHSSFPNTLAGVIYQPEAFTCIADGQFNEPVSESAYRAAKDALNGWDPSGGAIYYFNPNTATSAWIWSRPVIVTIGKHIFCA